ncbi:hypothetical protein CCO03_07965 [Comamonas serinivorans]|uniref:DUF2242 domain-containing protein n=1 Tax=Comamonas serinivorans TaxID=1082851 RepID=A0A1Y0ELT1_9BURK|nr:DUF2242 domain-containing protein [Comamonas serinivorans]ARU04615.1 hypothetical protein CCO03_07965 [Comamonas serinivorans]
MQHRIVMAGLCALSLAGCAGLGTTPAALLNYQPEAFSSKDTHTRRFSQPPGVTCEAARRALLSQGYIINEAKADYVRGRKLFQPQADRHVELEFRVVCAGEGVDRRVTEAFANGVQDQYGLRKVKSSASLGVGGVGSVSLPVQGDYDTLVKIASETVNNHQMYQRLFDLMERHLDPFATLDDTDAAKPDDKKAGASPAAAASGQTTVAAPVVPPGSATMMVLVPVQAAPAQAASAPAVPAAAAPAASAPAPAEAASGAQSGAADVQAQ